MAIDKGLPSERTGLFLLFPAGRRPTRAALRDFARANRSVSLTHDPIGDDYIHLVHPDHAGEVTPVPIPREHDLDERIWIEVLRDGLTFDLHGLAAGRPCDIPDIEHGFDVEWPPTGGQFEALLLTAGQHLTGGQKSLPVVQGLIALARDLTHHFADLKLVAWPPAKSAIGRRYFESVATAWLDGGPFPGLGLTAFQETIDGAVQSVGLDFWIGQELRIEPPLSSDKVSATRLGVRLVNQLVLSGTLKSDERILAPDGRGLLLKPSANARFIRVWPD